MSLHIHWWHYLDKWKMFQLNQSATSNKETTVFGWVCRCGDVKNVVKKNENQPPQYYDTPNTK